MRELSPLHSTNAMRVCYVALALLAVYSVAPSNLSHESSIDDDTCFLQLPSEVEFISKASSRGSTAARQHAAGHHASMQSALEARTGTTSLHGAEAGSKPAPREAKTGPTALYGADAGARSSIIEAKTGTKSLHGAEAGAGSRHAPLDAKIGPTVLHGAAAGARPDIARPAIREAQNHDWIALHVAGIGDRPTQLLLASLGDNTILGVPITLALLVSLVLICICCCCWRHHSKGGKMSDFTTDPYRTVTSVAGYGGNPTQPQAGAAAAAAPEKGNPVAQPVAKGGGKGQPGNPGPAGRKPRFCC